MKKNYTSFSLDCLVILTLFLTINARNMAHARPGMGNAYQSESSGSSGSQSSSRSWGTGALKTNSGSSSGASSSSGSGSSGSQRALTSDEIKSQAHPNGYSSRIGRNLKIEVLDDGLIQIREEFDLKLPKSNNLLQGGVRIEPDLSVPQGWTPRTRTDGSTHEPQAFLRGSLSWNSSSMAQIDSAQKHQMEVPVLTEELGGPGNFRREPKLYIPRSSLAWPLEWSKGESHARFEAEWLVAPGASETSQGSELLLKIGLPPEFSEGGAPIHVFSQTPSLLGSIRALIHHRTSPVQSIELSGVPQADGMGFSFTSSKLNGMWGWDLVLRVELKRPLSALRPVTAISQWPDLSSSTGVSEAEFQAEHEVSIDAGAMTGSKTTLVARGVSSNIEHRRLFIPKVDRVSAPSDVSFEVLPLVSGSFLLEAHHAPVESEEESRVWKLESQSYGNWQVANSNSSPERPLSWWMWKPPYISDLGAQRGSSTIHLRISSPELLQNLVRNSDGSPALRFREGDCEGKGEQAECDYINFTARNLDARTEVESDQSLRVHLNDVDFARIQLSLPFRTRLPVKKDFSYIRALLLHRFGGLDSEDEGYDSIHATDNFLGLIGITTALSILLVLFFRSGRKSQRSTTPSRAPVKSADFHLPEDPQFNWEAFRLRVARSSSAVMAAWSEARIEKVRHILSSGLYHRLRIQCRMLRELDGVKNLVSDFKVISVNPEYLDAEGPYETLHVRVRAHLKDITVPVNLGAREVAEQFQSVDFTTFEEIHSFTRKRGNLSVVERDPVLKHECPSCGAESRLSHASVKCEHCGTVFNSGEKDWVLSEITQVSEWSGKLEGHSASVLEDQAATLFWKLLEAGADLSGANESLRRGLHPSCETLGATLLGELAGKHSVPVVGALDVLSVRQGTTGTEASFEVRWSSCQLTPTSDNSARHRRSRLILALPRGEEFGPGYQDPSDCPGCGAPSSADQADRCAWCGRDFVNKLQGPLLLGFEPMR